MLKNLVFLSNSVPKSGSSLLFNLQRDFLMSVAGRSECDYKTLEGLGFSAKGGFVAARQIPEFVKLVESGVPLSDGPLIVKTHTPLTPELQNAFLTNDNVHISMIVRDPLDVLMSAMDNFKATGEFAQFETLEGGCRAVNNFFQQIYDSTTGLEKPLPMVHYRALMQNRTQTVLNSFPPAVYNMILHSLFDQHLDVEKSGNKAAHRVQKAQIKRDRDDIPADKLEGVLETLKDFRTKLGYFD